MFQEESFISTHEMGTGKGFLGSVNLKKWGSDSIAITLYKQSNKQSCTCLGLHDWDSQQYRKQTKIVFIPTDQHFS